jgi:hypothetical protein
MRSQDCTNRFCDLKPFVNSIVEEWFVNDESIRYDDLTVDVNVSSGEKKSAKCR